MNFLTQTWSFIQPLMAVVGAIVLSAGAITGFAYWIFTTYSSKWLDSKFAHELEQFKHDRQSELQRLKMDIDALLDRTVKLHGREFEALPQAWSLLDDAFAAVSASSFAFMQYANLEFMNPAQLDEFLNGEDFPNWKKNEIRNSQDKNSVYAKALQIRGLNRANDLRIKFHSYIAKNGIFFTDEIRAAFEEINVMMIEAFVERDVNMQHPNSAMKIDKAQALHVQGRAKLKDIQQLIHDRLWNEKAAPTTAAK